MKTSKFISLTIYKHFYVGLTYDLGLTNMLNKDDAKVTYTYENSYIVPYYNSEYGYTTYKVVSETKTETKKIFSKVSDDDMPSLKNGNFCISVGCKF